jgi:hypothetical protein
MRDFRPRLSSYFASDSRFAKVRVLPIVCARLRRALIEVKTSRFFACYEIPLVMARSMPYRLPRVISRID